MEGRGSERRIKKPSIKPRPGRGSVGCLLPLIFFIPSLLSDSPRQGRPVPFLSPCSSRIPLFILHAHSPFPPAFIPSLLSLCASCTLSHTHTHTFEFMTHLMNKNVTILLASPPHLISLSTTNHGGRGVKQKRGVSWWWWWLRRGGGGRAGWMVEKRSGDGEYPSLQMVGEGRAWCSQDRQFPFFLPSLPSAATPTAHFNVCRGHKTCL